MHAIYGRVVVSGTEGHARVSGTVARHSSNRLNNSAPLVPPKPNEFDNA